MLEVRYVVGMIPGLSPDATLSALLDAMVSAGLGCTVIVARNGKLERVYANEAIARIFGRDIGEMRALPPMDTLEPSERERLAKVRAAMAEGAEAPAFVATSVKRPDGTVVPVEVGMGYATVDGGHATFAFVRDVSTQATMERALRESEERFRRLAEAAPDAITVSLRGRSRYVYANPVALRFLGLQSLEELQRVDPISLVPVEQRSALAEVGRRLAAGEGPIRVETRAKGPDNREVVFESSLSTMPVDGQLATVSYARDITERLELQARLMQGDRLASVGMLAAGVAHELNNPLTTLTMQTRALVASADARGFDSEVRRTLGEMDEAVTRMGAIISDLLFMARPVDKPQAHVDVAHILSSTVALVQAGSPHKAPIRLEIQPNLPAVVAFASKLGQIFLNIVRNADQAVEGIEGGEVAVSARAIDGHIEIEVIDNGPGIPPEHRARIAQPFFTTKPNGTGLGLWISQTLIAQHGGTLEVNARPSGGTAVTIKVPAGAEDRSHPLVSNR